MRGMFRGGPRGGRGGFRGQSRFNGPNQGFQNRNMQNQTANNVSQPQQQQQPRQQTPQTAQQPKPNQNQQPRPLLQNLQKPNTPAPKTDPKVAVPPVKAEPPSPAVNKPKPVTIGPQQPAQQQKPPQQQSPAQQKQPTPQQSPQQQKSVDQPKNFDKNPNQPMLNKPFNQSSNQGNQGGSPSNQGNQGGNPFNQGTQGGNPFNQGNQGNQGGNNFQGNRSEQSSFNRNDQSSFNRGDQSFNQGNRGDRGDHSFNRGDRGDQSFNRGDQSFNQGGGSQGKFGRPFQNNSRGGGPRTMEERLNDRVISLSGPTFELPPTEEKDMKFSGHCRLYVGNITNDTTEEDIKNLFAPFGDSSEIFVNKDKNFAFVKMDYRASAEKAKTVLDGTPRKGKMLKIRFAPHGAIIKVKNLTPYVSNELLELAFSVFGEIERAYIVTDDRGKSTGVGIVEFQRKPAATLAFRKCQENCYFLTASLRPVIVELHEELSDPDGLPDKNMYKKSSDYVKEREAGPRFANINSFEHDYGTRWKQLFELRKQKLESAEREMKLEEEKLEAQMEYAKYEHETEMLREQLRQRESDRDRQKGTWEMKERQQEEQRRQDEEIMRRQQEEMQLRIVRQEEDMRRRQAENTLFMQAHQLNNLLDKQEQALMGDEFNSDSFATRGKSGSGGPGNLPVDPKAFMDSYDRGPTGNNGVQGRGGYGEDMELGEMERGHFGNGNRGRWDYNQSQGSRRGMENDFPNKRARRH